MLPRWFDRFLTSCPRSLRDMGYLQELINMRACREHCWWAWESHLQRSRAIIREAMKCCPSHRKAVILGSGPLHDVPLEELATRFREVVLVDIMQPFSARWQRRRFTNVRTVTADVTGTVDEVYRVADDRAVPLPRSQPMLFIDDPEIDLVASVNLLCQLPYLPARYLAQRGQHSQQSIEQYARALVQGHLDYLVRLPGVVAVVADIEECKVDGAGRTIERTDTIRGVPWPWQATEWDWELAPLRYVSADYGLRRRVMGVVNVKACVPAARP
jgi:hypothetical protein